MSRRGETDGGSTERRVGDLQILRLVWPFVWSREDPGLRIRLVAAFVLLGAMAGVNALVPILFAYAVDELTVTGVEALTVPVAVILLYGFLHWGSKVASEVRWLLYGPIQQRVQRRIGLAAFRHVNSLSLRFHIDRSTGQLSRILDNGLRGVREVLFDVVFLILPFVIEIVLITSIVIVRFEGWYAVVMSLTVTTYAVALFVGANLLRQRQRQAISEATRTHGKAIDTLLNYETVRYFGNEEHSARRYDESLANVERLVVRAFNWRALTGAVQVSIVAAGLAVMVLMAGFEVAAGTITVGGFVLVNAYLLQIVRPLERMGNIYRRIKTELANVEQLLLLFEEKPEITDSPHAQPLPQGAGRVTFEDVSFDYDTRHPILHHVSFSVAAGHSVAVVGPTGAGKSTIARLVFRSYDPSVGAIRIDGHDLRDVTQDSVHAAIGVIPQEPVLFNESIAFNIGFGRPGALQADIERAARVAEIHDFIDGLPNGYDTLVGERGLKLSGGEKQRIAIARVVLKDPPILLFDEATSSLDLRTEANIQANLRKLARERTTIVIAHRLSTVVDSDEILFLLNGRIVERGDHATLLASDGHYAALWRRQHKKEAVSTPTPPLKQQA